MTRKQTKDAVNRAKNIQMFVDCMVYFGIPNENQMTEQMKLVQARPVFRALSVSFMCAFKMSNTHHPNGIFNGANKMTPKYHVSV